ncbi:hypothetical protein HN807_00105 [Candidatus Bathyarchaeota archaeon]|jgi:hypothetical protein|nr:hypothetical protein [Candidatus Bathyarchaeota archaeon]MBT4319275.1 hypothetical protein [Candidatus Bathyarchaeota archaeon]MBT4422887.1 hypothetical protein [Candidatus Bathyarchaeota archaeon]MBT5643441.1 hypothetical protein [Candidatus Bathyarchaeota archaeon]MBT6603495.1 hypothetical protein [Candidatus Bathyarchaeota archaeon]
MSIVKKAAYGIVGILLIIVLVLGYLGFVPILSGLMGANSPRDLGISYTQEDIDSANGKLGVTYVALPPSTPDANSVIMEGFHPINVVLGDNELTALFNDHADNWGNYPMSDIQVRFNPEGDIELSGVIETGHLKGFADSKGYDEETRREVRPYLNFVMTKPAVYLKGDLDVINGVVTADLQQVQIGRLSISSGQLDLIEDALEYYTQHVVDAPNVEISYFNSGNGGCDVQAIVPSRVSFAP